MPTNPRLFISGGLSLKAYFENLQPTELVEAINLLREYGGMVVTEPDKRTVVLCRSASSENRLAAFHVNWLHNCIARNQLLDLMPYMLESPGHNRPTDVIIEREVIYIDIGEGVTPGQMVGSSASRVSEQFESTMCSQSEQLTASPSSSTPAVPPRRDISSDSLVTSSQTVSTRHSELTIHSQEGQSTPPLVWKGVVKMKTLQCLLVAEKLAGCAEIVDDLPAVLNVTGKVDRTDTLHDISWLRHISSLKVVIVRLISANAAEKFRYISLYTHLKSSNRLTVIDSSASERISHFYIMPVASDSEVPSSLLDELKDIEVVTKWSEPVLLGIIVKNMEQRPSVVSSPMSEHCPAKEPPNDHRDASPVNQIPAVSSSQHRPLPPHSTTNTVTGVQAASKTSEREPCVTFSRDVKKKMIQYLIENDAISKAGHLSTWKKAKAAGLFEAPQISARKLRSYFVAQLLYKYRNYTDDPTALQQFRNFEWETYATYSEDERHKMIQYLVKQSVISEARKLGTWQQLEVDKIFVKPPRSATSLWSYFCTNLRFRYMNYTTNPKALKEFKKLNR